MARFYRPAPQVDWGAGKVGNVGNGGCVFGGAEEDASHDVDGLRMRDPMGVTASVGGT